MLNFKVSLSFNRSKNKLFELLKFVRQYLKVSGMQLYNKQSADERRQLITEAGLDRLTLSFYKYHQIKNPKILRDHLFLN